MAGPNKVVKSGEVLFRVGDPSAAGMFVVRQGELVVFLEKEGKEIILARVGAGGLVGEMALFEEKPRSASVRAFVDCEVTQITSLDFEKLMKQIPKWFVGLMGALSSRLRQTNDRLQKAENQQRVANMQIGDGPFRNAIRLVQLLDLVWARDGEKAAKDLLLSRQVVEDFVDQNFHELLPDFKKMLNLLVKQSIIVEKSGSIAISHRILLRQLCEKLEELSQKQIANIPERLGDILRIAESQSAKSAYDQVTMSFEDLIKLTAQAPVVLADLQIFGQISGPIQLAKTSTASGTGLKITKNDQLPVFIKMMRVVAAIYTANI